MKGKLIVLDGLDGSGKSTQSQILFDALKQITPKVKLISYPDYEEPSSVLVRMYLDGAFSGNVSDVNAYAASSFYAVDRYASYMQHWKHLYEDGYLIIASRYVSSNAMHQMVKLPKEEWDAFLAWLDDYEFHKLGLPEPDLTIFLEMSRTAADRLILSRYHGDENQKDIHEQDTRYLAQCMESARHAAARQGWKIIQCCNGVEVLPLAQISAEIMKQVKEVI